MLDSPFRGSDAVRAGLITRGLLRGPRFVRVFPDVYLPADIQPTFEMRSRAAFLHVERRGGVLAGYSAAQLLAASCEPRGAAAEVLVPAHIPRHRGLLVHQGTVAPEDLHRVVPPGGRGVLVTGRERTAWDLARRLDLVEAVVAVDALARPARPGGPLRFEPAALLDRWAANPGARGVRRLDRVVALAAPRAESPMETRLRLVLVLGELPPPVVQYVLCAADGRVVARLDLAYPQARLALEYDGGDHDDVLDRERDLRTGALGWHTMRFRAADILRRPERTLALVREQLAHRSALFTAERELRAR
ncbi:endonuclease domain-containing protein [Pseudonocardia yuanmonensis]|uniref:endonuclease domain-containing protein n=1 Tax=Pseudonocardia yuanmonensis TaxID=1095914 RepID=UPI0031ECC319